MTRDTKSEMDAFVRRVIEKIRARYAVMAEEVRRRAQDVPERPRYRFDVQQRRMTRCQSTSDGDCYWSECPQLRDGEPKRSGRHCPLDKDEDEDQRS